MDKAIMERPSNISSALWARMIGICYWTGIERPDITTEEALRNWVEANQEKATESMRNVFETGFPF